MDAADNEKGHDPRFTNDSGAEGKSREVAGVLNRSIRGPFI